MTPAGSPRIAFDGWFERVGADVRQLGLRYARPSRSGWTVELVDLDCCGIAYIPTPSRDLAALLGGWHVEDLEAVFY